MPLEAYNMFKDEDPVQDLARAAWSRNKSKTDAAKERLYQKLTDVARTEARYQIQIRDLEFEIQRMKAGYGEVK